MDPAASLARFGLGEEDLDAWRQSGLQEDAFVGWLTDRVARRPSGPRARKVYGAEDVHDFARGAILDALVLVPDDRLLEVGCGGGLLLREAVGLGARATGIDHSQEMVDLARERAPGAQSSPPGLSSAAPPPPRSLWPARVTSTPTSNSPPLRRSPDSPRSLSRTTAAVSC